MHSAKLSIPRNTGLSEKENTNQSNFNYRVILRQWRILDTVVSCGNLSNAAAALNLTQPAISQSIAKLENDVGLPLLKIKGRKAHLTEPGNALLQQARLLLKEAVEFENYVELLQSKCRPAIRLAVDYAFPTHTLISALHAFSLREPNVDIVLTQMSVSELAEAMNAGHSDLAIAHEVPIGFWSDVLTETEYVAVAHPGHRFFEFRRELTQADLNSELEIACKADVSLQIGWKAMQTTETNFWQVTDYETAIRSICAGFGYGWLPKHQIIDLLDKGGLKFIPLQNIETYNVKFYLAKRSLSATDSEVNSLVEMLYKTATSTKSDGKWIWPP
jgi:DNA-binding transcriptional LysR family regulator